ncbi:hypothetical protein BC567DRAFT_41962 [Phyllosticta citribraziliensis]
MPALSPWIPIYTKHDAVPQPRPLPAHHSTVILASPFNYQYNCQATGPRGAPRFSRPPGRQDLDASCRAMASTNRLARIMSTPVQGFHPSSHAIMHSSLYAEAPPSVTSHPFQALPNAPLLSHAVPSYSRCPACHVSTRNTYLGVPCPQVLNTVGGPRW